MRSSVKIKKSNERILDTINDDFERDDKIDDMSEKSHSNLIDSNRMSLKSLNAFEG
jgi:hypothetical protein